MNAPPTFRRGALWQPLQQAAAQGRLVLQACDDCGQIQYPPRELCRGCLSAALTWRQCGNEGTVLSWTRIHAGIQHAFFRARAPWSVGAVEMDAVGVVLHAYLSDPCLRSGAKARLHPLPDGNGEVVFVATSPAAGVEEFDQTTYLTQEPSA